LRQRTITENSNMAAQTGNTLFELDMVGKPRIAVWISTLFIIVPCRVQIKYFRFRRPYCYFRLSVVVAIIWWPFVWRRCCRKLDFVTWITTILILDLFCHISQHGHKISPVSKTIHTCLTSRETTSGTPIDDRIVAFIPTSYSGKVTKGQRSMLNTIFLLSRKLSWWFFYPKRNTRVNALLWLRTSHSQYQSFPLYSHSDVVHFLVA